MQNIKKHLNIVNIQQNGSLDYFENLFSTSEVEKI